MNRSKTYLLAGFLLMALVVVSCKKTETTTEFVPRPSIQVDRMGIPTINTALIPSASKDAFNQSQPSTDAANFRTTAQNTITGLRTAVDAVLGPPVPPGGPLGNLTAAQVAGALIPDIVTIDFSMTVVFPNGRRLEDDVINAALGIVLNRGGAAGVSDAIDANDKISLPTFPYLAADNVPLAKPAGE